ncbi:hypothetical protein BCP78_0091 [Bacillus phage BCP78]|uniref:Uncharacterized protein n=3 Tax=Tsarbombavirus BCP78 TaxID=1985182 RepID=J9PQZ5_9CAUD|nr:hypothetical protein BCP78_0091 [Bacillus phage BCP78]YP_009783454.1 hypothetical protein QLX27_gp081 [Bacillus phage BCU4]ALA07677.1 hypothetical protein PBC6_084 [Bacillus phage PBC6]AQN32468.1 hypothetical protein BCP12_047 [Bacillus phage BCP12]AXU41190.1 hypothetical protein BC01_093 [Bacillus phage BC01]AEW47098.1 hypothetical protein BCP78_0091 [Bacillus phage BCP78]AEW47587.1 hypothetical protein BCU4_0081 [Bacillus phage BCU4]
MITEGYLTPEDFDIAEKNGIHRELAHNRFYHQGFSKEKAITKPVRNTDTGWSEWKEVALSNGICWDTFNTRLNFGYTPERAATEKVRTRSEQSARARKAKKRYISDELIERARLNGIQYTTLYYRLFKSRRKWTEEEAATTPPLSRSEVAKIASSYSPFKKLWCKPRTD